MKERKDRERRKEGRTGKRKRKEGWQDKGEARK